MKKLITLSLFLLGISFSLANASEKVSIGQPSWIGAKAIAHLIAGVVEKKIGGEVNLIPGNNATIFQAMNAGKGDIDVHPDVWLPNQQSFTDKYVKGTKRVELSKNSYVGKQSFCVSRAFSKRYNVKSIYDLARPKIARLMDSDGNGKGEIWVGAPGWASANVNEVKVRDYGLLPFIEPVRSEQSVMQATVADSIKKRRGYAFYCYSPHAIWFLHDIVRLSEPKYNPAKYIMIQPSDDPDWYKKSYVATEDALKSVQVAFSKSLKRRSPLIYELLKNMKLTSDDVSYFAFQIAGKKRDPKKVISQWIRKNDDRVDSWLGL